MIRERSVIFMHSASPINNSLRSKCFRLVSEPKNRPRNGISVLTAQEMKGEPKNERGGRGRGRKETLTDKPLDFENLRSPGSASRTILSCVDQRFVSY